MSPAITDSRYLVTAGWDDVPHLSEEAKAKLLSKLMPHQRQARIKGVPALGSGAIYPVDEEDIEPLDDLSAVAVRLRF